MSVSQQWLFGPFRLDRDNACLWRDDQSVPLRPKAFSVLEYLTLHAGQLVTNETLLNTVWAGVTVSDAVLKVCISDIRKALGKTAKTPHYIATVQRRGYRFLAPVIPDSPLSSPRESPPGDMPERAAPTAPRAIATGKHCTACQHPNDISARFCATCGTELSATCPHCGQQGIALAVFCSACGQRLITSPDAAPPSPTLPSAAGERKLVTVLCAVVAPVRQEAPPELEALHHHLRAVYARAEIEVERYGGMLQPLAGDCVLALFGAPVAQEDYARRAVLAALGLQQQLQQQPLLQWPSGAALALRFALHTGQVAVGPAGAGPFPASTVIGDVTTHATALARQATPGTILISAATLRLVAHEVQSTARPSLRVDETSAPIPVAELLAYIPGRGTRAPREAPRRSPFLGRDKELAVLHAGLGRARQGQGQVVGIIGEAGMGKSRLLGEFHRSLAAHDVAYLQGHCQSYGEAMPYLPLRDLLRSAWKITDADSAAEMNTKIQTSPEVALPDADAWAPYLRHVLTSRETPDPRLGSLSPEEMRTRTFDALHHFFLQSTARRPSILALEDLHWIDPTSAAYLRVLTERLVGMPLLLLVTFRPGYRPDWMDKSYATQIALAPLAPDDSRRVVRTVLRRTPLPEALEHTILAQAEGNPLFLEELAHTVAEQGGRQLAVPETVQAVLATRIDRLPPVAKSVLQAAAVLGKNVPLTLLQALVALPEETFEENLAHLQAAELFYEAHRLGERVYTFKHVLTQEVAYRSLLQTQRQALHRRVVAVLASLADGERADRADMLAQHAWQGEIWEHAWRALRHIGAQAMARSAHHEAATCYEQALHALQRLPQTPETREQAIDLYLELRNALVPLGELARISTHLHAAAALAEDLDDTARLGRVTAYLTRHFFISGEQERAIAAGQRALAVPDPEGLLHVPTHLYLGYAYHALGAYRQAITMLERNVTFLAGPRRYDHFGLAPLPAVSSQARLAQCFAELGAFAEGSAYGEDALRLAEDAAHPFSLLQACRGLGVLYLRQGMLDRAIPLLERGLALCQEADLPLEFPMLASALGSAYLLAERSTEALPLLEQAVAQSARMHRMDHQALRLVALSEGYLSASRVPEAQTLALEALELSRTRQERGVEGYALCFLGALARRRHDPEVPSAETYYRHAIALAENLTMRPLLAHSYAGLGIFYAHTGQTAPAHTALRTAAELFRAMAMTPWLPEVEATLTQLARFPVYEDDDNASN